MFRGTLSNRAARVGSLSICLSASVIIGFSGCSGFVNGNSTAQATPTPLTITVSSMPSGTAQATYSATLSVSGGTAPYSWSITSGSLPPGLVISPSGQISGTPTQTGTFSFTVRVTDSSSPVQSATANLNIAVAAAVTPVQITTTSLPGGQVNSAYAASLTASGGIAPYTWSLSSGSLPAGLALVASGQISGTPTASGTSSFTVKVTDSSSPAQSATASLSIVVAATVTPVQITTTSLPSGQVNSAYSAGLAASGGTAPYTWSLSSGSLPAGLALVSSGQISGTPTTSGTSSFTVTVTDSSSPAQSATANLSLTIVVTTGGGATVVLCPNNGQTGNNANCAASPTLTFGKQGTGTTSAALTISVSNCSTPNIAVCTGTGSLTLGSPYYTITGANAADFSNTGLGTCSNGLVVNSGSNCTIILKFTPSQASGTNESATLTVNSNGASNPDTMSLTGTSATVTTVSSCQALNGGTNYQLAASVSASGTCFTLGGSNVDLNLNGFTVTYGNAANSSVVAGVMNNSSGTNNIVVHNGTINEGAGPNTGTMGPGYGSGMFMCANNSSATASGWQMFNVTGSIKASAAKVVFVEDDSAANPAYMHDIVFTDTDPGGCSSVGCRAEDQYYAFTWSDNRNGAPVNFYNISGTGAPQGGIVSFSPGSTFSNNNISPGGVSHTVSNGFAQQMWGSNQVAQNNLIVGTGPNGSCVSCRGIQTGSAGSNTSTNNLVQNNVLHTYNLNNDPEYGGCQIDGSYGIQINTAGSSQLTTSTLIQNNKVFVNSGVCPGFAFSWSGANTPANNTKNNYFSCTLVSGGVGPCAGARFDANQYNPHQAGVISTGDTFIGDTSSIYVWYDGTPTWTCNQCTFGKGSNPISAWVMLDNDGGGRSGQSSDPMFLIDPTFTGGATKDSNNLAAWASSNPSLSFSYTVQWTYTVTVKGASSGSPISGATVTATDSQGAQECNGTTNSSGVFSCVHNNTKYAAASGQYKTTSYSPLAMSVAKPGCTTLNYSLTLGSKTTETRTLPGC